MMIDTNAKKKSLEFEINLVPFIDMLSACLSFLLLTAVWTYVGTIDTKQAIGAVSTNGAQNPPSVIVQVDTDNSFEFQLKDVKTSSRNFLVRAENGQPNWAKVESVLTALRRQYPEITTSVVLTRPKVKYGLIIKVVDSLKKANFKEVGISPT